MIYLYRNLLVLRKKRGYTQAEIAAQLDIKPQTWSNYENGNTEPHLEMIIAITKILGVTLDELVLTNFDNAQVLQDFEERKIRENAQVNAQANAQLKGKNEGYYTGADGVETRVNEPGQVGTWALMGQIKGVDEKLDQLRLLVEKALKK